MGTTFDVTSIVSTIESVPLETVGAAIIGLAVVAMGYKWIKGMIFG
ncbi:hypothetical protein H0Z60_12900 [Ectothiorhodospiraceae bacterium WFHF3C12]|nr:hypothetical protein [Ectothiorhodospiraceae bacterium WFHF3C12]